MRFNNPAGCPFAPRHPCGLHASGAAAVVVELASPRLALWLPQKEGSEKPVSDQWLDSFVIVGEDNNPVGTVQDGEQTAASADNCFWAAECVLRAGNHSWDSMHRWRPLLSSAAWLPFSSSGNGSHAAARIHLQAMPWSSSTSAPTA